MRIVVTGGAGYIGSHAALSLLRTGHQVLVLDSLARGHAAALDRVRQSAGNHAQSMTFERCEVGDREAVTEHLRGFGAEAVMHFAALAYVGESVDDPLLYHWNNTAQVVRLLQSCRDAGVNRFVFSSTCATYGEPQRVPIAETEKQHPINPYGWSKLHVERVLADEHVARRRVGLPFAYAALRYFNVAGCDTSGTLGEDHRPETHLIPILLQVALGQRPNATVFGTDYPTPDGTCVRDYIHVQDLVNAHADVLDAMGDDDARVYNLGIGRGYSVLEILEAVRRVTGHPIPVEHGPRRAGDPPALFADPKKIRNELGWNAQITDLDEIIASAWAWFQANPEGYPE